jgi:hypothetical protein
MYNRQQYMHSVQSAVVGSSLTALRRPSPVPRPPSAQQFLITSNRHVF